MSRTKTWLVSEKIFFNYFRAFSKDFPQKCHSCFFTSDYSVVNYSSYLSSIFRDNFKRTTTSSSPEVPPTGGTFSFSEENSKKFLDENSLQEEKIVCLLEIEKIPTRYREGLIRLLENNRPKIYLCSFFNSHNFSYELASKSDSYLIKKRSWIPIAKQLSSIFRRASKLSATIPKLPEKFTLKEKVAIRLLWKFRHRFVQLDELSSYLYGYKMPRNLHSSEAIISELRKKLNNYYPSGKTIERLRNYGYKINEQVWNKLFEDSENFIKH